MILLCLNIIIIFCWLIIAYIYKFKIDNVYVIVAFDQLFYFIYHFITAFSFTSFLIYLITTDHLIIHNTY